MKRICIVDNEGNPINGPIEALGQVNPGDTLIIKFPFNEIDIITLEVVYKTLSNYYPDNKVIMISKEYDILDPKSREEYKAFLKDELAKLEETNG